MPPLVTWAGRAALALVLAVALYGAINPHHQHRALPADVVEHVIYGYLLTLLSIVSLPRVNPWLIGAGFLFVGVVFELTTLVGLVAGTFQWRDLGANGAGVAAALAPMAVMRQRLMAGPGQTR